jgi:dATP pyrophosphohydrolase
MNATNGHLVEVYPFRFHDDRLEYLLLRRSPMDTLYPGIWQIVTGSMEEGETPAQAAVREFREETGLIPSRIWVLPQVSSFYDVRRAGVESVPLFCCQVEDGQVPLLSDEHAAWQWLSAAEAKPLLAWPSQRSGVDLLEWMFGRGEEAETLLDLTASLR